MPRETDIDFDTMVQEGLPRLPDADLQEIVASAVKTGVVAALKEQAEAAALKPAEAGATRLIDQAEIVGTGRQYRVKHDAIGNELTYGPFYKGDIVYESQLGPHIAHILKRGAIEPLIATVDGRLFADPQAVREDGTPESRLAGVNARNAAAFPDVARQFDIDPVSASAAIAAEKPIS